MHVSDFTNPQGDLVRNLDGEWSYVPKPLPPSLDWDYSSFAIIHDAAIVLSILDGLGRRLPNPQRLVRMFLRREAHLSSRIEDTHASVRQIALFENARSNDADLSDVLEVTNNFRTLEFAIESAKHRDITQSLLKEMHAILLQGDVRGHDKTLGAFRRVQAHIGTSSDIKLACFVPAPPHAINDCMASLEQYLGSRDKLFPVVRAAIVHYQFETIHPFADGNGRVGRVLLLLQLIKEGVLCAPLLNPSAPLLDHRRAYYDGLLAVSQRGEWQAWISFFAQNLAIEARDAAKRIERFEHLREEIQARVALPRASALLPKLVDDLFADPVVTVPRVIERFGISPPTARSLLDKLEELRIIHEITKRQRGRVYVAHDVIDLFSDSPV